MASDSEFFTVFANFLDLLDGRESSVSRDRVDGCDCEYASPSSEHKLEPKACSKSLQICEKSGTSQRESDTECTGELHIPLFW